jgi:hypothetical protein
MKSSTFGPRVLLTELRIESGGGKERKFQKIRISEAGRNLPSKESGHSESSIDSGICVTVVARIDLTCSAKSGEGIEGTRAQKADEAKQANLGEGIIIDSAKACAMAGF